MCIRDRSHEDVDDPSNLEDIKTWQENGLGACIDIIADYEKTLTKIRKELLDE